jgi:hypothetical protein
VQVRRQLQRSSEELQKPDRAHADGAMKADAL